jgi:phage-related protein
VALTIGELVGFIRFDPSGVDDGANQAENRMRQLGNDMGNTANQAGQSAGQQLGDGIVRGADGRLRNAQGQFVATGRQIGDSVGDGVADGASAGGEEAAGGLSTALEGVKGMLIGGAIGAALMEGLGQALEQGNITSRLGAQLGATPAEAEKYGKIAGSMYSHGLTEDFQQAADAIRATMSSGLAPPGATNSQIQSIATKVNDLANTFELDLGQSANAVGQIMKTGLAPNAQTALDVITRGLQVMGPRADDIADTFNEYSTLFRQMGLSAADATGIMAQGLKAGARDTDVVADSLKEFVLIAQGGGKEVEGAFQKIGLNGKEMQKVFSEGGPKSKEALDKVFDALRKVKDPADRSGLALTLFGTKAEDMQKALFAIDPSKAEASLGKVGGAAKRMGDALHSGPSHQIEVFKRTAMQGIVNVMGSYVIPALMKVPGYVKAVGSAFSSVVSHIAANKEVYIAIASVITAILLPSLITMATTAITSAATTVTAWATQAAAAVTTGATYVGVNALILAGWIRQGAAAAAAAARVVAAWVLMGVQSMIRAAQMAAAWLIAMGPIGWIIAAVVALVALIIANWDKVKAWTLAIWDWVWNKIKGIAQFLLDLFMNWSLIGLIITHWDTIKSATKAAWDWVMNAIKTVWEWIKTAVVTYFNFYLTIIRTVWNTIKSVSQSVWNGIKSVITTVWNAIKSGITTAINAVKSVINTVWNGIKSLTSTVWNSIKSTITNLINGAKSAVSSAINSIKGFFSSGFNAVKSTVSNALSNVVSTIKGLAGRVKSAVSGAASWLVNAGKSIIEGLINGIKSMAGKVGDAVKGVLKGARDLLPFSPAKKGPFSGKGWTLYSGRSISEALARGILQRKQKIADATKRAVLAAKRAQIATAAQSTKFQTGQQSYSGKSDQEGAAVQNGYGGRMLSIQNYYESDSGSATKTALELEWLAKVRG